MLSQYPLCFGQWLQWLAYALWKPREIAIAGEPGADDTQALLSIVRHGYCPFQVVALGVPGARPPVLPLLQDRGLVEGQAAAQICDAPITGRAFACQALVTQPEKLQALL